jgi:hypothetical protein
MSRDIIYLSHIIIIAPIMIYIGFCKNLCSPYIYQIILTLGIFALIYHLYLYFNYLMQKKDTTYTKQNY